MHPCMLFGSCISLDFATVGYVLSFLLLVHFSLPMGMICCLLLAVLFMPMAMLFLFLVCSLDVLGVDDQAHHLLDVCIAFETSFAGAFLETPL